MRCARWKPAGDHGIDSNRSRGDLRKNLDSASEAKDWKAVNRNPGKACGTFRRMCSAADWRQIPGKGISSVSLRDVSIAAKPPCARPPCDGARADGVARPDTVPLRPDPRQGKR